MSDAPAKKGLVNQWRIGVGAVTVLALVVLWNLDSDAGLMSTAWRMVWAGGIVLLGYLFIDPSKAGVVFLRAVSVAIPIGLLGAAVFLFLKDRFTTDDIRYLYQAAMAGGVVVGGWIFTFMVQSWRDEAQRERHEEEMLLALWAEIRDFMRDLETAWKGISAAPALASDAARIRALRVAALGGDKATQRLLSEQIAAGDGTRRGFHAFTASPKEPVIFNALKSETHRLPTETLQPIVRFYAQLGDLTSLAHDLQRPEYARLPPLRRARIYAVFESMSMDALRKAYRAWQAIDRHRTGDSNTLDVFEAMLKARPEDMFHDLEALARDNPEAGGMADGPEGKQSTQALTALLERIDASLRALKT